MTTLTARMALIAVSAAAWFELAVLGWGGFAAFFSHPARVALIGVIGALVVASFFAGENLHPGEQEDRTNRPVVAAVILIGLLDGFLPAWSDRNDFWIVGGDWVRWFGVALCAVGGALRLWPVYVLGDRFSGLVGIQRDHTLVTGGVYRCIRNPGYLGLLVMMLGWGLAFRSGVGVVLTGLLIPPLATRMDSEETLLAAYFGAAYQVYRARTSRLIPWIY